MGNQFSTFDSSRNHPQRIQSDDVQRDREAVPEAGRTKTIHTSEDRPNQGTIPMPTFATRPLTTSSLQYRWNYHLAKNNYSFDALQVYCFGINLKL